MENTIFKKEKKKKGKKLFIITTYDFSALPYALKMKEEPGVSVVFAVMSYKDTHGKEKEFEGEEEKKQFEKDEKIRNSYADGMIKKVPFEKIFSNRDKFKGAYWIWDMHKNGASADILRREGFKVFAGSALGEKLEEDRKFGMDFMKKNYGINPPEEMEYKENSADKAIADVEKNEEKAWVFKPDKELTVFLPRQSTITMARKELLSFMEANKEKINLTPFVLQ